MKTSSLLALVDNKTYDTWVSMLKVLGSSARTHRISVVVASMLQYSYEMYIKNLDDKNENEVGRLLLSAFEEGYDEAQELLHPVVKDLFMDAGINWKKTNSKGQGYCVISSSIDELYRWHDMPWE